MTATVLPARPETIALFISDLHLQTELPATTAAFLSFLRQQARHTRALYLLGDIFEYWAGDDDLDTPFVRTIVDELKAVSDAGVALFWIAGNRDFLVGPIFAAATGATLLDDPAVITCNGTRYLISHGDLLCTDDVLYQQFRSQSRQPAWQAAFLARPLSERKQLIAQMRLQSQQHQRQQSEAIMDVNVAAVAALMQQYGAQVLIHGHTHRPALHQLGASQRYVLSDWDCDHASRGDWLALQSDGSLGRYAVSDLDITINSGYPEPK